MADEPTNNGLDNGPVNDSGDEQHLPDGSLEPLSPQEADNTDYGLMVGQRVQPIDLQDEMRQSYLSYALSVIVERALPDVRDGMKPVHRRVVYAMYDGGYRPDRGYNKCSRVVGDVMASTTRTATPPSTTPWCVWPSRGRCATCSSTARQLRLPGRRPGGRHALHRMPYGAARHGNGARHR